MPKCFSTLRKKYLSIGFSDFSKYKLIEDICLKQGCQVFEKICKIPGDQIFLGAKPPGD
jgi:hypothetical protein